MGETPCIAKIFLSDYFRKLTVFLMTFTPMPVIADSPAIIFLPTSESPPHATFTPNQIHVYSLLS
ncbi:MAG: hypothetical protein HWD63_00305 [Candidatus Parvibacillus calidus]|nr:MAG: hypothetical protein HWD63_00305 [Candidatus Parvibacillus calidus]WKZ61887.1 MAG: hypothetical protein QY315_08980 [Saprospiraceae bacterium]